MIDFVSEESINACIAQVEKKLRAIKALINCVGILGKNEQRVEDVEVADFDLVYAINLRGALIITKMVIKGDGQSWIWSDLAHSKHLWERGQSITRRCS